MMCFMETFPHSHVLDHRVTAAGFGTIWEKRRNVERLHWLRLKGGVIPDAGPRYSTAGINPYMQVPNKFSLIISI